MLKHYCLSQLNEIKDVEKNRTVVLLDYDTNDDIENWRKPLSHASLIKRYIETIKQ